MMLFLIQSDYLDWSKRLCGLQYLFQLSQPNHDITFTKIGYVALAHQILQFIFFLKKVYQDYKNFNKIPQKDDENELSVENIPKLEEKSDEANKH